MFVHGGGWGFFGAGLMWFAMVVVWGLAAWLVYRLVGMVRRGPDHPPDQDGARRTLDERLARGEIDVDEYTRRRDLLGTV